MAQAFKSQAEMELIRKADAKLQEKARRDFVPEKNAHKPVAYFQVSRYVTGSFRGLFRAEQMIVEDAHGKPLKKPISKVVADGVDMVVLIASVETALRRKVFR